MRLVVVFDTNILISALLSVGSKPDLCINLARNGEIESVTCTEILGEFHQKLIQKFHYPVVEPQGVIDEIVGFSRIVVIPNTLQVVEADPKDDMIVECGVVGKASHIITGDKKHLLPMRRYQNIDIVTATDFLTMFSVNQ
ncbi:MAG: putative toxin-antitoxin system toxin component, PIN family [Pseudanabaena sp.]